MAILRNIEIVIAKVSPRILFKLIEILRVKSKTYSEFGEDITLDFIIKQLNIDQFSYIDIGCHRPISGSNTYKFYREGKRGTAVDANEALAKSWELLRKKDNFLNLACSTEPNTTDYYIFDNLASSNTTSQEFAKKIHESSNFEIKRVKKIKTMTLTQIIQYHKISHKNEFFISIDIEGKDQEVIKDWLPQADHRPFCIVIEDTQKLVSVTNSPITKKLNRLNYRLIAHGPLSSFFIDNHKISNDIFNYITD